MGFRDIGDGEALGGPAGGAEGDLEGEEECAAGPPEDPEQAEAARATVKTTTRVLRITPQYLSPGGPVRAASKPITP
jgi:hypothetical protein